MANLIAESYKQYVGSKEKFDIFHNNVINMPRADFSKLGELIKVLKSLASYIECIEVDFFYKTTNIKKIYEQIFKNFKRGIVPSHDRNDFFEDRFLNIDNDFESVYENLGRQFRHYIEYLSFFGIIKNNGSKFKQKFDMDALQELLLTPEDALFDIFRNKLLEVNIKNNAFIENLRGISINTEADYRPAKAIISYCYTMDRPCTDFEISILLGRVDDLQDEKLILQRAVAIGKIFPRDVENQKKMFFGSMNWKTNRDTFYEYSSSQNPNFKFKSFLLFMKVLGLIEYDNTTNLVTLTPYSKELAKEEIPFDVLELENLLKRVDDDTEDSNKLMDIILRRRTTIITQAIQDDGELVTKLNQRNLRNPIIKNGKRVRSRFIAEVAKIKANYLDELTNGETFEGKDGKNYVEAHHIIEFNTENGPDITDNLICLGPENHSLIHHGSTNAVNDFYLTCQSRGVIKFDRFKSMCVKYNCLTKEHVKILLAKKIISQIDATELNSLIDKTYD